MGSLLSETYEQRKVAIVDAIVQKFSPSEMRDARGEWTAGIRDLADKLDKDHPGTQAGDHARHAADAMDKGDAEGAYGHLSKAYEGVRSDSRFKQGVANDQFHMTAHANMNDISQRMKQTRQF